MAGRADLGSVPKTELGGHLGMRLGLAAVLILAAAAALSVDVLTATGFGGWPSAGLLLAAYVVLSPRWRPLVFAAATLLCGAAIGDTFEVAWWTGLLASSTITVPGWVGAHFLCGSGAAPIVMDSRSRLDRWHLATAGAALLTGVLTFVFAVLSHPLDDALAAAATGSLGALSSHLIVVPLLFARSPRHAQSGRVQQTLQVTMTIGISAMALLWLDRPILLILIFPMLAWAGVRMPLRAGTTEVFAVALTAYCATLTGHGPFVGDAIGLAQSLVALMFYLFVMCCGYVVVPIAVSVLDMLEARQRAVEAAATVDRLIESATGTYLVATDADGRITRFNQAAADTLGWSADDVLGRTPELFHTEDEIRRHAEYAGVREPDHAAVSAALADLGVRRHWQYTRRTGETGVVTLQVSPIRDDQHEVVGYITAGEDTTHRHRAHAAMTAALAREQAAVQRLLEADHVKHELVSTVSHELRTPITTILGYAEVLEEGQLGDLSTQQAEAMTRIRRNAERMARLVEDLLTLSSAETDQLEFTRCEMDLASTVVEVVDELRPDTERAGIALRHDVTCTPVHGDPVALRRVVLNLAGNALKFSDRGDTVTLTVRPSDDGGAVLVVADTGIGMAEADRDRLFTQFFRAGTVADQAIQGAGLGLTVTHAIVTAHGGRVAVDSELGEGTTVRVTLPPTR